MSSKTFRKRIALVATAALGFGLMSVVPASALYDGTVTLASVTVTTPTATTTVGTATSSTFKLTSTHVPATGDYVAYTLEITAPTTSALYDDAGAHVLNGLAAASTTAATVGTAKFLTTGTATVADWAVSTTNVTDGVVTVTNGALLDISTGTTAMDALRGGISINPDVAGTYTVTLTATPYGPVGGTDDPGTSRSATFVVTATDPANMYVSKYSSVSYTNSNLADAATSAGTTVTFDSAHGLTSTSIGKAIYSIDYGYIGTIASITSTTVVELTAAATTALVSAGTGAAAKLRIGSKASTYTTTAVLSANQISSLTATAGKTVALDVVGSANAAAGGQVRASLDGYGVVSSEIDNTTLTHFMVPFTAPASPGTYAMTVEYSEDGSFSGVISKTKKISVSLVVTAASGLSTALSTSFIMGAAAGAGAGTVTTNAASYSAYKTSGTKIAQIEVTLKNADGTAAASGHTVAASVTGSGFVTVDNTVNTAAGSARASSAADGGDGIMYVHIAADGTAGTGTITVSVTDAITSVTTALGTWTVTSFGAVASLSVTPIWTIGYASGDTTGAATAARGSSLAAQLLGALDTVVTPAFIVKTVDSAAQVADITNSLVPTIVSSNTTSVSGGVCVKDDGLGDYSSGEGVGYYNCEFTTTANSKSGDKATLTIRTLDPASTTGAYLTTTLDVTVGGDPYKESLTLDKTSYAPGEAIVVTRSAIDDKGNPVADGSSAPNVIFNKAIGGTLPAAGYYVGGKLATSSTKPSVFAPVVTGAFEARMSGYNSSATATTAIIAPATVSDDAATAASTAAADAAAEATDAANAATDAANAAAEAADAATAAAQDAADAVAALSAQFNTLVSNIKAQISSLTALIVKIQKKVKA